MDKNLLEEIKLRLDTNRYELKKLDEMYIKAFSPCGYKTGTSYQDFDTIHGSRKEFRIEDFEKHRNKLIKAIEYDEEVMFNLINSVNVDQYLKLLAGTKERIDYLRNVQEYTLKEIEEKLGISRRHIQRVLKKLNSTNVDVKKTLNLIIK